MALDPRFSVTLNFNIIGIITTGILIGIFFVLSVLYYIYVTRDKLILYLIVYFTFVFCNLFVSSVYQFKLLDYYEDISFHILRDLQLLFDYCIIFCFYSLGVYLMQRRFYFVSWFLVFAIVTFVAFGHYSMLEIPVFFCYLTICLCICIYLSFYEIFSGNLRVGSILLISYVILYFYYFLSYTLPSSIVDFDTIDWIVSIGVVISATLYFLYRYKYLITNRNKLYDLLIHDNLTGLYSKNFLLDTITNSEIGYIIFIDINNFKYINDSLGHLMGDHVLTNFSKFIVQENGEFIVLPCRYGGDEFVLYIQNASLDQIQLYSNTLIGNFRDILKELAIDYVTNNIGISIGISKFSNFNGKDAIISADFAMYEAKNSGNNNVSIHLEEVC
jgi:diguanylate cyclase (GGDEF)-like protein